MPIALDGKLVRDTILASLKPRVEHLIAEQRPPGLAVVLVGSNPASEIYVRSKVKACADLGIASEKHMPMDTVPTEDLLFLVESLNRRPDIDGILVQLPLPEQVDEQHVLLSIDPTKDVDGFHPRSVGDLVANRPGFRACTPAGVMRMLAHYEIPIAGKHAVVMGRSDIVGKPMALLLLHRHATVTICHSKTRDLAAITRQADILIAAIGRTAMITGEHVREGAVVIDVGTNDATTEEEVSRIFAEPERSKRLETLAKRGRTLVGDVEPRTVAEKAAWLTPVPGGVGPLTIAMLMQNTLRAAEMRRGL